MWSVFALPRFPLSKALKRYMMASMGKMRKSSFHKSALSFSYVGRWLVSPSTGTGAEASWDETEVAFPISGSLLNDMLGKFEVEVEVEVDSSRWLRRHSICEDSVYL
jgi:hypothetical protein